MPAPTKPFELSELEEVANLEDAKKYRIICLQGAGFSSWDEPHTTEEIKAKFWQYADDEELFEDRVEDYSVIPAWFTTDLICDLWEVRLEEL